MRFSVATGLSCTALSMLCALSCVDTSEHPPSADPTAPALGVRGGLPQRLWDRYALRSVGGNALPALFADSAGVRYRVVADTLFFHLSTSEIHEVAVVRRETDDGSAQEMTLVGAPHVLYVRNYDDLVTFPSLLFGTTSATLSGATRVQPFSTVLLIAAANASYAVQF